MNSSLQSGSEEGVIELTVEELVQNLNDDTFTKKQLQSLAPVLEKLEDQLKKQEGVVTSANLFSPGTGLDYEDQLHKLQEISLEKVRAKEQKIAERMAKLQERLAKITK